MPDLNIGPFPLLDDLSMLGCPPSGRLRRAWNLNCDYNTGRYGVYGLILPPWARWISVQAVPLSTLPLSPIPPAVNPAMPADVAARATTVFAADIGFVFPQFSDYTALGFGLPNDIFGFTGVQLRPVLAGPIVEPVQGSDRVGVGCAGIILNGGARLAEWLQSVVIW